MATAPEFRFPRPDESLLQELVDGYVHITGDPVRRPGKRNLIATCYRVHGDDFLPLVQRLFTSLATATNLLGIIRVRPPTQSRRETPLDDGAPSVEDPAALLRGLTYSADTRPAFQATSTRRHDRRLSNPDARTLFDDEELEPAPRRSPTADALGR